MANRASVSGRSPGFTHSRHSSQRATLYIDTRERYGYTFAKYKAERKRLIVGDYAALSDDGAVVAAVERKAFANLATSLNDGTLSMEMIELARLPHAAVVVEADYSAVIHHKYTTGGYLETLIARLAVRYPHVPILFLGTRKIAEHWVALFLQTAHATVCDPSAVDPACAETPTPTTSLSVL